jgi:ubiquitin-protein ligase
VSDEGHICLSVLLKECSWDNGWSPALSIAGVLLSILVLLGEPATGAHSVLY